MNFSSLAKGPTSDLLLTAQAAQRVDNMLDLARPFYSEPFPGGISELWSLNCTKFREIIGPSLHMLHKSVLDFRCCSIMIFDYGAAQKLKIKAKFRPF